MSRWGWIALVAAAGTIGCGTEEPGTDRPGQEADPCADASLPATFEAEEAELQGVEASAGDDGAGWVADFDDVGDQVTFEVCVPEAGYYTLEFRYAKGSEGIARRTILVGEEAFPAQPQFPPQWSWDSWEVSRRSLHLEEGRQPITLAHRSADLGEIRLDSLTVSAGPSPSQVSVRALLMNDWEGLVSAWHAARLYPVDDRGFGPRMAALHTSADWPTNQIDEAQAFLRDETGEVAYDDPNQFDTAAWFGASDEEGYGELRVEYGPYGMQALPVQLTRRQIVPPGEDFVLVLYEMENRTDGARAISLLEWADAHNKSTGPSEDAADTGEVTEPSGSLQASWNEEANAWFVDMTETNGTVLVVGAFDPIDRQVAGEPASGNPDAAAAVVQQFFDDPASLTETTSFEGVDVGVGLHRRVEIEQGGRAQVAFFYGVTESVEEAGALAARIRDERSPEAWAEESSNRWETWLDSGRAGSLETPVEVWSDAFATAMITIRQSQQPEFGSFVAATNPGYFYSVWPRDASVTALGLDAAGYLDEAEKYWLWMAQAQEDGSHPDFPEGTWWTNYGYWEESRGISFVEPEWDSLGLFLVGVYRHHEALEERDAGRAAAFLEEVWPAVVAASDFIESGARDEANEGFGPADYSIWEEDIAYHTFTQTTYVAGLRAAELLAEARGEANTWGETADSIRQAIFRDVGVDGCPGLWSADDAYFIRSVSEDCVPDRRVDGASDLLWVFGVLDAEDPRAASHREAILANLTPSEWGHGIARYEGDTFYNEAASSPGGIMEALEPMPTWPQMASYMAMLEHWTGMDDLATDRLSWYVSTAPRGLVPHGEAVDWSTQRPLISTAAEPVTGAWFSLALLNYLDLFDPRLPPREGWGPGETG